jgi:hypothetical protein
MAENRSPLLKERLDERSRASVAAVTNAVTPETFTIEDVSPDRLRRVQWVFTFVPALAPTVKLVRFEELIRPSTRHRFRDSRAWWLPEHALSEWQGEMIARPGLTSLIKGRVRQMWRSYFAFE